MQGNYLKRRQLAMEIEHNHHWWNKCIGGINLAMAEWRDLPPNAVVRLAHDWVQAFVATCA